MTPAELPRREYLDGYDWENIFGHEAHYIALGGPAGEVTADMIRKIIWVISDSPEGYASREVALLAELEDGWFAMCEASADTTGWDCRGAVAWKIAPSLQEAATELSQVNRSIWEASAEREQVVLDAVSPPPPASFQRTLCECEYCASLPEEERFSVPAGNRETGEEGTYATA